MPMNSVSVVSMCYAFHSAFNMCLYISAFQFKPDPPLLMMSAYTTYILVYVPVHQLLHRM